MGTPQQAQAAHAHAISTHTHAITSKGTDLADETFDGDEGHVRVHGIRTCHAQPLSRSLTDTHAPLAHNAAACACFESHGNTQQQAHTVAGHDAEVVHLAWFAALDHQTCVSFRHPYAHTWLARARQISSRAAALSGDCRLLAPSQAASADKRTLGWQPRGCRHARRTAAAHLNLAGRDVRDGDLVVGHCARRAPRLQHYARPR